MIIPATDWVVPVTKNRLPNVCYREILELAMKVSYWPKVADGARDNWEFLAKELPPGEEVVDFYHAAQHLRRAFGHVYGEASPKARASFNE